MISIHVEEMRGGGYTVSFQSNNQEEFYTAVTDFKTFVPANLRSFDHESKTWHVDEGGLEELLRFVEQWRGIGRISGLENLTIKGNPYAILQVRETACVEVVRAAYRALTKLHHPDVGGDTERMKEINVAYDRVIRERGEGNA